MSTLTVRAGCPLPAIDHVLEDCLTALSEAEGNRLTMRQLAERAGWSRRTILRHGFPQLRRAGLVCKAKGKTYRLTAPWPAPETAVPVGEV